jgi:hypothetical protein
MSKFIDTAQTCPHCNAEMTCRIAVSLNVTRSPVYREAILEETFHAFTCDACEKKMLVEEPFIYTDFTRQHWIGVFPRSWEPAWALHEASAPEAFEQTMAGPYTPAIARKMAEGFIVRTVFGLSALREKLMMFDAGIDDALLETIKMELMKNEKAAFHPNYRPFLYSVNEQKIEMNIFTVAADQSPLSQLISVPRSLLEELKNSPSYALLKEEFSKGSYADIGRLMMTASIPGDPH